MNRTTWINLLWALILGFLATGFEGCGQNAVNSPSPLRAMRTPAELQYLGQFTDQGMILYAAETIDSYEQGSLRNEIIALSGGGIIGGLGTGAVAAPPAAQGLLIGANAVLMALNLWRPVDRSGAYSQGSGLIREALGAYMQAVILDGYCTVPNNRVTPAGAILFAQTNAAIKLVNDLRQGILSLGSQSVKVLQAAQDAPPLRAGEFSIPDVCKN